MMHILCLENKGTLLPQEINVQCAFFKEKEIYI